MEVDYSIIRIATFFSVIFLITRGADTAQTMIQAHRLKLKEYAFITLDMMVSSNWTSKYKEWGVKDVNELKDKYLSGLIYVSALGPNTTSESYRLFSQKVKQRVTESPFSVTLPDNITVGQTHLYY